MFHPDVRNRRHQRYCSARDCRLASKAASQRRWLLKPENQDYFKGPANVQRVQAWRTAHPGYSRRIAQQDRSALQDLSLTQVIEDKKESRTLAEHTLQDLFSAQPLVLIGLIAHLTHTALQDEIAQTGHRLRQLGQDIVCPNLNHKGEDDAKIPLGACPSTSDPPPVQLDRPTPGPGSVHPAV